MLKSHEDRSLFLGFIKLHILHHANKEGVYGLELIEELGRHGYVVSPGTLYPVLHKMQKDKLVFAREKNVQGKIRKIYNITSKGKERLQKGYIQARELMKELNDKDFPSN